MRLNNPVLPAQEEWIPMPEGSELMVLPHRHPVGYDPKRGRFVILKNHAGQPVLATAVFMAPAYTQLYRAAFVSHPHAPVLPLFAYSPVGWKNDRFWVTAIRVDQDVRQDPAQLDPRRVEKSAVQLLSRYPGNRLVEHLVRRCVREYRCPNAQNFVLGRWECPVPTSPFCSAGCVGCISEQQQGGVMSTQNRITFVPTEEEILAYTVPHLRSADRGMISFGQGCEGEPLLQGKLIESVIQKIRRQTNRGTIHLNTNAGHPETVDRLFRAGLDSIRISINSARPPLYEKYHRPKLYRWTDVLKSIRVARDHNAWISINYFIFPGLTDSASEMEALIGLLKSVRIDCIQMRNLNIDPEWYIRELDLKSDVKDCVGMLRWQETVRKHAPWIRFGYFNPPKEDWGRASRS